MQSGSRRIAEADLANSEPYDVGSRELPVEVAIAQPEALQALVVATEAQQDFVVTCRIGVTKPLYARRRWFGVAPGAPSARVRPRPRCGVQAVDAVDERGVSVLGRPR